MSSHKYILGLDVGGTKIEIVLLEEVNAQIESTYQVDDRSFNLKDKIRIPTQREKGYEFVIKNISTLISDICSSNGVELQNVGSIGIGLPGSIDPQTSIMINGNSEIFIGKNIIDDLKNTLSYKNEIYIDNDANLFALAETYWGVGRVHEKKTGIVPQKQISIGIIIGTGCGGGIIIEGKQIRGRRGGGAEIGHTVLVTDGFECYCKRSGCAEQYISGTGLERIYEEMNDGKKMSAEDIFKNSKETVDVYIKHLSTFLTNMTNIFDPDYIVLGGGVSNQSDIYEQLRINNRDKCFITNSSVEIYQNVLGDSAGVLGAALFPILIN